MREVEGLSIRPDVAGAIKTVSDDLPQHKRPEAAKLEAKSNNLYDDASIADVNMSSQDKISVMHKSVRRLNEMASLTQSLTKAISDIDKGHEQMLVLAEQAKAKPSELTASNLIDELRVLAKEVDSIVDSTEINGNKIFSSEGKDISITIGDSTTRIKAMDLRVDVSVLTEAKEAGSMVAKIREEIEAIKNCAGFLLGVSEQIEEVSAQMQFEPGDVNGLMENMKDLNQNLELGKYSLAQVQKEARELLRGQANIDIKSAESLLEYIKDTSSIHHGLIINVK